MVKIIAKGLLKHLSQDLSLTAPIQVNDLSQLLHLPEDFANNLIVVREHLKLESDDIIQTDDEIYLFLATMGG